MKDIFNLLPLINWMMLNKRMYVTNYVDVRSLFYMFNVGMCPTVALKVLFYGALF